MNADQQSKRGPQGVLDAQEVYRLRKQGETYTRIAATFGVSKQAVQQILKRHGLVDPPPRKS
jgi:DNA invertase Pin-like site-specific DNA recombinase